MNPLERFLAALKDYGYQPKQAGAGWSCRCPAHEDRNPSLSIHTGDDGRVLVKCHAGCTVDAVCGAVGLAVAELFPERSNGTAGAPAQRGGAEGHREARSAPSANISDSDAFVFPTSQDAIAELERRMGASSARWTYTNAEGEPVGIAIRWDTPKGKNFCPVARTADGCGWHIGGMGSPRPLYDLPCLLKTQEGSRVFVVEGEKAADAVRSVDLVATTSAHGAKSASKADWSALGGRQVVILPDHDASGERYAEDVARLAIESGAKSVRIVRLAEVWESMPEGGDFADMIGEDGPWSGREDADIRAELEALADKAEEETVESEPPEVQAFKPFPTDALPEPIRAFVTEGAKAIGCNASYIALPLLSGLASAIGNTHRIELKPGWPEPSILWTAIIGDSGTTKSPALELALRPIRKRQHRSMKDHAEAMSQHAEAMASHEREAALWKKSNSVGPPPPAPEAPTADRCWTDDATTEALAVLLKQNPRGLLMARDELAGWFDFDKYTGGKGGGDVAKWLEMHGGRALVVDRKGSGMLYVPRAAVSIAGGIQPEALQRALGKQHRDNGLAARLLFAYPPRLPKKWTEAEVDPYTEAAVEAVFDTLFALLSSINDDGDECPRLVKLTPEGKAAWIAFYNAHAREQVDLSGDESAAWAKLEGYAARLALVVHLTRFAAGDSTLADPGLVDAVSVAAGVQLAQWFGDEARRVYAMLSESDDDRSNRKVAEWVARKGGAVTPNELAHGLRAFRCDSEAAERALDDLVKARAGYWEPSDQTPKRGRPTRRFRLGSPVTVTEKHRNTGKKGNIGDGGSASS